MHGLRSLRRLPRRRQGGFTLLEAMVAISVVALIGILIYGVFNGMSAALFAAGF